MASSDRRMQRRGAVDRGFPPSELGRGPPRGRAGTAPLGLGSLGLARPLPSRQWLALGSRGEFPTELSLWLIGLGVGMHWNNPRRPQENGVVERSQGTSARWCEPWTCRSPAELQVRLERMDRLYREVYPYQNRRSRLESSRTGTFRSALRSGHRRRRCGSGLALPST